MTTSHITAHRAADAAWSWICSTYRITGGMPSFYLSRQGRFPKFMREKRRVRIVQSRLRWGTYVRKRVGWYADWVPCTRYESWVLQFVHEFTHAVQGDQGRRYSEVETTRNEIAYARDHFPHLFARLTRI